MCRILLPVLADVYLSNFMLWISKSKALVVTSEKLFPIFIIFHTKEKSLPSYNYPQLHTLFIGSQTLVCALPGNCHLCSSRLFFVSNTLSPHHFCLWLCPPKLPVVGYVPCLGFWYNPGSCCFLFFCCMTQFTHAHFVICYLIFFLSSDLHFSLLFCINKNKSLSLALISFIFFSFHASASVRQNNFDFRSCSLACLQAFLLRCHLHQKAFLPEKSLNRIRPRIELSFFPSSCL